MFGMFVICCSKCTLRTSFKTCCSKCMFIDIHIYIVIYIYDIYIYHIYIYHITNTMLWYIAMYYSSQKLLTLQRFPHSMPKWLKTWNRCMRTPCGKWWLLWSASGKPQLTIVYETAMVCIGLLEYFPAHVCGIRCLHGKRRFFQYGETTFRTIPSGCIISYQHSGIDTEHLIQYNQ